jgi:hypothetical protein
MGWPLGVICWPCTPDFQAPNSSKGHASPHTLYPLGLILNPGGGASGEGLPSGTQESRKSPVMVHKLSALKKRPRPQSESWDASLKHTLEQPSPRSAGHLSFRRLHSVVATDGTGESRFVVPTRRKSRRVGQPRMEWCTRSKKFSE